MEKKKRFQIQMGWGGLFAFFITSTCILVWVFVMGFWLGQKLMMGDADLKMAQKPQIEDLKSQPKPEPPKEPPKEPPPPEANMTSIPTSNEALEKKDEPKITDGIKEEIITAKKEGDDKKADKITVKGEQKTVTPKTDDTKKEEKAQKTQAPQAALKDKEKEKAKEEVLKKYFAIQVASFNKKENAADEVKEWQAKGFKAQYREVDLKEKGIWYRVYVGRYKTLEEAKEGVKKIGEKKGQTTYIVSLEDK